MLMVSACVGPVDYLNTSARKAQKILLQAEAVEAQVHSPYAYWSAVEYLQMSREKAAVADFEAVWHYGRMSLLMAELAKVRAQEKMSSGVAAAGQKEPQAPSPSAPKRKK
jgi:hypothetical protein